MKKRTRCVIKTIFLLVLFCFCLSFMKTAVDLFICEPDLIGLTCAIPLVYVSYKCIIEIAKNAFYIKFIDFLEDGKDEQSTDKK